MRSSKITPMSNGSNDERVVENPLTLSPDRNENRQILPLNRAPEQSYRSSTQSNANFVIAGSIGLFCGVVAFGITALAFSADKSFSDMKNQTSFGQNLRQDEKYGIAFAVSASIFLGTFSVAKRFLDKEDDRNYFQNYVDVRSDLVFENNHENTNPSSVIQRSDSLTNLVLAQESFAINF